MQYRPTYLLSEENPTCFFYLNKRFLASGIYSLKSVLSEASTTLTAQMECTCPQDYVRVLYQLLFFHTRKFPEFPPDYDPSDPKRKKIWELPHSRYEDGKPKVEIVIQPYNSVNLHELEDCIDDDFEESEIQGDGIHGWMFMFTILSKDLDIDEEMSRHFKQKEMAMLKTPKLESSIMHQSSANLFSACPTESIWFNTFLPTVTKVFRNNRANQNVALGTRLNRYHSFALNKVFTRENALMRAGPGVTPVSEYYILGDRFYDHLNQFLDFKLCSLSPSNPEIENVLLRDLSNKQLFARNHELSGSNIDLSDYYKDIIAKERKECGKVTGEYSAKWEEFVSSKKCIDLVCEYLSRDEFNPGRKVCVDWLMEQMRLADKDDKLLHIQPRERKYGRDPSLTVFGNIISLYYYKIDELYRNHYNHEEQFNLMSSCFQFWKLDESKEARSNIAISGPAIAGKSYLLTVLKAMTVPGFCLEYSGGSKNAHTGDSNWNMYVVLSDEGPKDILSTELYNVDKTGDPVIKSMLSQGYINTTRACKDEETGKIINVQTITYRFATFMFCMNPALSSMPLPIASRMYGHHLPSLQIRNKATLAARPVNHEHRAKDIYEFRISQGCLAIVGAMYQLGIIDNYEFNTEILEAMQARIELYLNQHHNLTIDMRAWARIVGKCKENTLLYAFNRCFLLSPSNRGFEIGQLLELRKCLVVTREVLYFTISQNGNCVVSPYLKLVMDGIRLASNHGNKNQPPVLERNFNQATQKQENSNTYYFLSVLCGKGLDPRDAVYNAISSAISTYLDVILSPEIISDVISQYLNQNASDKSTKLAFVNTPSKSGLRISRAFYVQASSFSEKELLDKVLRFTMDKYTPARKYVLASTERLKKGDPTIPRVIISHPNISEHDGGNMRSFSVPNIDYIPESYSKMILNKGVDKTKLPVASKILLRYNYEQRVIINVLRSIGGSNIQAGVASINKFNYERFIDPESVFKFDQDPDLLLENQLLQYHKADSSFSHAIDETEQDIEYFEEHCEDVGDDDYSKPAFIRSQSATPNSGDAPGLDNSNHSLNTTINRYANEFSMSTPPIEKVRSVPPNKPEFTGSIPKPVVIKTVRQIDVNDKRTPGVKESTKKPARGLTTTTTTTTTTKKATTKKKIDKSKKPKNLVTLDSYLNDDSIQEPEDTLSSFKKATEDRLYEILDKKNKQKLSKGLYGHDVTDETLSRALQKRNAELDVKAENRRKLNARKKEERSKKKKKSGKRKKVCDDSDANSEAMEDNNESDHGDQEEDEGEDLENLASKLFDEEPRENEDSEDDSIIVSDDHIEYMSGSESELKSPKKKRIACDDDSEEDGDSDNGKSVVSKSSASKSSVESSMKNETVNVGFSESETKRSDDMIYEDETTQQPLIPDYEAEDEL